MSDAADVKDEKYPVLLKYEELDRAGKVVFTKENVKARPKGNLATDAKVKMWVEFRSLPAGLDVGARVTEDGKRVWVVKTVRKPGGTGEYFIECERVP